MFAESYFCGDAPLNLQCVESESNLLLLRPYSDAYMEIC